MALRIALRKLHIVFEQFVCCMANRFLNCRIFSPALSLQRPQQIEQHLNIYVCFVQTLQPAAWDRLISIVYFIQAFELKMTRSTKSIDLSVYIYMAMAMFVLKSNRKLVYVWISKWTFSNFGAILSVFPAKLDDIVYSIIASISNRTNTSHNVTI